jgi:hypothetical protein
MSPFSLVAAPASPSAFEIQNIVVLVTDEGRVTESKDIKPRSLPAEIKQLVNIIARRLSKHPHDGVTANAGRKKLPDDFIAQIRHLFLQIGRFLRTDVEFVR